MPFSFQFSLFCINLRYFPIDPLLQLPPERLLPSPVRLALARARASPGTTTDVECEVLRDAGFPAGSRGPFALPQDKPFGLPKGPKTIDAPSGIIEEEGRQL